ncbi:nuclear autoantigenic sperm protein-like [Stegodyphus dumicola]|uniref:nuclear autoantigenic sperm protein-like n=1 Tax=Stegodyphus dumicola TaxID=202533 RepID=UPI0015AB4EFF|nr:nuclear autoantigenic sperm protein-like [Stegodyphus dumicola]
MEDTKGQDECSEIVKESPSSSKDLSKSLPEEAFNNFLQGKRHMLVQDYTFAVQSLATACELYVKHFGELALECGEVYFLYGKALFRLSQQQAGVLGDALNEGSNEDEDDEKSSEESKENGSEKNASDTEVGEDNQEDKGEEKEPSESTDSPEAVIEEADKDTEMRENESSTSSPQSEVPKENQELNESQSDLDKSQQDTDENQQENEEDDLELAWNTLETAKTIFKRQGEDKEAQLKIAEILVLLAEISMESGNNVAAIKDLTECLTIQKCYLSPDDRSLAETYYQMGLALSENKQYDEALENFKTTMQILQLRIENIKKKPVPDSIGTFAAADQELEISDLENVLVDIKEKIEDTEEQTKLEKKLEEALANASKEVSSSVDSAKNSSKPISNITHLLKRKKPESSSTDGKEMESKRLKISSSLPNGDTAVLPDTTTSSET